MRGTWTGLWRQVRYYMAARCIQWALTLVSSDARPYTLRAFIDLAECLKDEL